MSQFVQPKRTLKQGSKGDDVKAWQTYLNGKGHSVGTADGIYGAKTVAATKALQKQLGIKADGIAGPDTFKAVLASEGKAVAAAGQSAAAKAGTATQTKTTSQQPPMGSLGSNSVNMIPPPLRVLKQGMEGPDVHAWQRYLNTLPRMMSKAYMDPPAVTGHFDAKTKGATMVLQQELNVKADGIVGPETVGAVWGAEAAKALQQALGGGKTSPAKPPPQPKPEPEKKDAKDYSVIAAIAGGVAGMAAAGPAGGIAGALAGYFGAKAIQDDKKKK